MVREGRRLERWIDSLIVIPPADVTVSDDLVRTLRDADPR